MLSSSLRPNVTSSKPVRLGRPDAVTRAGDDHDFTFLGWLGQVDSDLPAISHFDRIRGRESPMPMSMSPVQYVDVSQYELTVLTDS